MSEALAKLEAKPDWAVLPRAKGPRAAKNTSLQRPYFPRKHPPGNGSESSNANLHRARRTRLRPLL